MVETRSNRSKKGLVRINVTAGSYSDLFTKPRPPQYDISLLTIHRVTATSPVILADHKRLRHSNISERPPSWSTLKEAKIESSKWAALLGPFLEGAKEA